MSRKAIRAAASRTAHFEKHNDAHTGNKGATIFRDSDQSDTEIVSIMFEMKNESDETATKPATKKRNEDFLKELDKDRTEKACEYAVLVPLLQGASKVEGLAVLADGDGWLCAPW